MFALVDCNNFFVSCERLFRPDLHNKPVAVLSNNDGCIIARSNEVKQLGIAMGAPYFKVKDLIEQYQIQLFSSNFMLYGNISKRIMDHLQYFTDDLEIYSIDEAFLKIADKKNLNLLAKQIATTTKQNIGVPVSVGIADSKTLAKIAAYHAKQQKLSHFVINQANYAAILQNTPIEEIWGIGYNLAHKLRFMGIGNAFALANYNQKILRQKFNVVLEKTCLELQGKAVLNLERNHHKKNIMSSRSFGRKITELNELYEAISCYSSIACRKLRKQHSKAQAICVILRIAKHAGYIKEYKASAMHVFATAVADENLITAQAKKLIKTLYVPGKAYCKAGILLFDLVQADHVQTSLFNTATEKPELFSAVDQLNNKYGKNTLFLASCGTKRNWQMRSELKSPNYVTNWQDLPKVFA